MNALMGHSKQKKKKVSISDIPRKKKKKGSIHFYYMRLFDPKLPTTF